MDSLLASYASSDDEEEAQASDHAEEKKPSSISTQLPPPKSKPSLFSTLPPPKTNHQIEGESKQATKPIFSSLPQPKSQSSNPKKAPPLNPNPKRVVQFTLPLNSSLLNPGDFDDDEEEERKPIEKDSSSSAPSKGLSSMLPAPKNSLCLAPTAASRRSAFDSNVPPSKTESFQTRREEESTNFDNYGGASNFADFEAGQQQESGSFEDNVSYPVEQGMSGYENYASYDGNWAANEAVDSSYATSYMSGAGGGGDYGSYAMAAPVVPEMERIRGKRGRNEIPEIVEVNQAELMKNRPREDQVKVTGIAFGPAYQVWDSAHPSCCN